MVKVGIIGLGFMGQTHFKAYQKLSNAKVVAIADVDEKRARGDLSGTWGNIGDVSKNSIPMEGIRGTTDFNELINFPDVDLVDVCVPTPQHPQPVLAALKAGKHVLCEKPMARTSDEARKIAEAAESARGYFMPAMCVRFWPQWAWLKQAVADGRYGKVRAATFRRLASTPGGWFRSGEMSGGAILDLHIHDTDFISYLFGKPKAVHSRGYTKTTGQIDHIVTDYIYDQIPLVHAEGGWCLADGFDFRMQYIVNFENATADYALGRPDPLVVFKDKKSEPIKCPDSDGWVEEIRYLVDCIERRQPPSVVTARDAYESIRLIDAERRSVETGQIVTL